ncbi:MAG: HAD-IIA family hydrolase [Coriobacteriia bacterium]|nr:HAD-IIA family hydrolase [Coriobacteriia bacterium]MCL2749891.1 HAD-IIA family hydrolase [Coriobacteriia bacterium]
MNQCDELTALKTKQGFICDMDGVIYSGESLINGALEFVRWLEESGKRYLFLTNASAYTPLGLKRRLARLGLNIDESQFYTSALATAEFLHNQSPGCSAYVIGDSGLHHALNQKGISMDEVNPDYVVVGETRDYNYDKISRAIAFVENGARLIGAHPDITSPGDDGLLPAARALVAPIELATGRKAYYVGKPNALMMRTGISMLGVHSSEAAIIGDRMDTDIIAGIESGITTVLVLTGVTAKEQVKDYPYRPKYIFEDVGELAAQFTEEKAMVRRSLAAHLKVPHGFLRHQAERSIA